MGDVPGTGTARDAARDRVAAAAVALVEDGMTVGLGTGDTARRFVAALAARVRDERLRVSCVVTSQATDEQARAAGLDVRALPDVARVHLAFDGADEIDPGLALLKGGGGAQTRERIVAASADAFVVLADETKLVPVLGVAFPVAIELVPEAFRLVARRLVALGAAPIAAFRPARGDATAPFVTDLGHRIIDARFPGIPDPAALSSALDAIPGVVGHGIFAGLASLALVGETATPAVRRLVAPPSGAHSPGGTP